MRRGVFDAELYEGRGGYPLPPPPPPPYMLVSVTRRQAQLVEMLVWALLTAAAVTFLDVRWEAAAANPAPARPACPSDQVIDLRPNTLLTCPKESTR